MWVIEKLNSVDYLIINIVTNHGCLCCFLIGLIHHIRFLWNYLKTFQSLLKFTDFFLWFIVWIKRSCEVNKRKMTNELNYAQYCWRSKDELISDVLLWTPTYGQAKGGRPARTYIQPLCEDTGCCPKDLPEVMNDREKWRERVWDICASGTTWWW